MVRERKMFFFGFCVKMFRKNFGPRYLTVNHHWLIMCKMGNEGLLISF